MFMFNIFIIQRLFLILNYVYIYSTNNTKMINLCAAKSYIVDVDFKSKNFEINFQFFRSVS